MGLTKVVMTGSVDTIKEGFDKVNDIIDDLAATTSGLGASCIGVYDAADNMAATNVEAALVEIYSDVTDARTLADIFAENPSTTTGLTWGYKAGAIRVDNVVTAVVAGTLGLTDDATNYVEINSAGTVSKNTTGFTSGRVPLRIVVCASGAQSTSTDKRAWFVPQKSPTTNGQLIVGSTGADPVLATLTGTSNQVTVTNGEGTITLSTPQSINTGATVTFADITATSAFKINTNNTYLKSKDAAGTGTVDLVKANASNRLEFGAVLTTKQWHDGTNTIDFPTNGMAAAKFMLGNSSTIAWFYLNTAPPGWKVLSTGADTIISVSGGTAAYNANGGTAGGTWTQPNHTHTGPSHTHGLGTMAGPNHTHTLTSTTTGASYGSADIPVVISGGDLYESPNAGASTAEAASATTGNPTATALSGAMASDGTGATSGSATANTWRPSASVGKLYQLD